jgi:hypothetical protein
MQHKKDAAQAASLPPLGKNAAPEALKAYFTEVFRLEQSGKRFPANLDSVWPLAYGRKEEAVRTLKSDFIEGEDFIAQRPDYEVLRRNAENPLGGRPAVAYFLSTPCLEYLVAKRVKPIFEVYRQVFHRAVYGDAPRRIIDGSAYYGYDSLLQSLGMRVKMGNYWKRMRRNPQEFNRENGVVYVSQAYAGSIRRSAEAYRDYALTRERREAYLVELERRQLVIGGGLW